MSQYEYLVYRREGAIDWIYLNRPERLNAVIKPLYDELVSALEAAEHAEPCRVIVISGMGRAFCVGADLKVHAVGKRTPKDKFEYLAAEQAVAEKIIGLSKPVVAAVNGYAIGAGAEIATACDFLCMADSAEIGFPEASIGAFFGGGITLTLPQKVGLTQARRLLYFGERLPADQAKSIGLADEVFSQSSFVDAVTEFAQKLAEKSPVSLAWLKQSLQQPTAGVLAGSLAMELNGMSHCSMTQDWQAGLAGFSKSE